MVSDPPRFGTELVRITACYNCGASEASTRDHVIPKSLIPKPWPANLPTVPACESCNRAFSKDEEYVRDRLAAVVGDPNYQGSDLWDVAWRSLQDPKAHGKKIGFFKDIRKLAKPVLMREGSSDLAVAIQKERAHPVIEKMVRGIYYYRFKERLDRVDFWIEILSMARPNRDLSKTKIGVDKALRAVNWKKNFGPHTWAACGLAHDDRRGGVWFFGLFGGHLILALTVPVA